MNKTFCFTLLFLFLISGLRAQVVYKDAQGRFVIDNTALPANSRKTAEEVANTIGSDGLVARHIERSAMNVKLSPKFEISGSDDDNDIILLSYSEAAQACKNKDGGNQGWRMPTQRELLLVLILRLQLESLPGFTAFPILVDARGPFYWTSTAHGFYPNYVYRVDMQTGQLLTTDVRDRIDTRCVRDL